MTTRFVVPLTWPAPPAGWTPSDGWQPDPSWRAAPEGWRFWQEDTAAQALVAQQSSSSVPPALPTPIARKSWVRRLGWLLVLVGGLVAYFIVNQTMIVTQNVLFFPTVLLIGSVTVPAAVLLLEYAIGQGLEGRGGLIIGASVVAGIVGVTLAGWLENTLTGPQTQVLLGVAIIEELAKLIVPVVIFLVARRRLPRLGLALGIGAGAGFAVLETMGYGFYALVSRGGGLAAMQQTLQERALLAPASHLAWTGMVVWALWRIAATPRRRFAITGLVLTFSASVGLHYLWDLTNDLTPHIVLAVISVAILMVLMVLSARRDAIRSQANGPATGPAAIAPVPQRGSFRPVELLSVQADAAPQLVSVPERHAA